MAAAGCYCKEPSRQTGAISFPSAQAAHRGQLITRAGTVVPLGQAHLQCMTEWKHLAAGSNDNKANK